MSKIALVLAMADNGVIGADGRIPWRIPEDMRRFKALTLGKPCIMGRRTWASLPKRPLPGRTNIVVTRAAEFADEGALVARSLDDAIRLAKQEQSREVMVIGGGEIYAAALPFADTIYLTEVHAGIAGDTHMAAIDREEWREGSREDRLTADGLPYSFVRLERRGS